jgi:Xaa-Pro aminopeptidase
MTETVEKLTRIRKYLKDKKLDGIVLNSRANFAWLTGGGDNHVVSQSERGVGALVVTGRQAFLVANRIEIDRLHHEEPLSGFQPKTFPWTQTLASALPKVLTGKKFASDDCEATGLPALPADFAYALRASLSEHEVRRYKALGRDCALAIETVARQLQKGDSEHQVEADLARHLLARGIQPFVVLVAFDQRMERYRHPAPTANHLRHAGMLVLCGQRGGLIASLTRLVHFGPVSPELHAKHEAVCRVEVALWQATVPGATYAQALKAGLDQYKKEGHAKEWELHHQGGPTGYAGREFMATPDEKRTVLDHQAVAWNPSITGTKSEDTFITDGRARVVITACSADWPTIAVKGAGGEVVSRPAILVR